MFRFAPEPLSPPRIGLDVIDCTDGDGAYAQRIVAAAAALTEILSQHCFELQKVTKKAPGRNLPAGAVASCKGWLGRWVVE
jgi:hypothetical protein